jgi:ABC-type multidrug transport system ATPase subunit
MAGVLPRQDDRIPWVEGPDRGARLALYPTTLSLYGSLTVGQAIRFHQDVYGIRMFDENLIHHTKIEKARKSRASPPASARFSTLSLILSTEPDILLIDEVIHSIDAYLRKLFLDHLISLISRRTVRSSWSTSISTTSSTSSTV